MSHRAWLVVIAIVGGALLAALAQPFVYDFARYEVLDGFAASLWTWLAVVVGVALAIVAVLTRRATLAPVANLVAGSAVALALLYTSQVTPGRDDPPVVERDCANMNIGISCRIDQVLDALTPGPRAAVPRRWIVELALGGYVVASGAAAMRRRT